MLLSQALLNWVTASQLGRLSKSPRNFLPLPITIEEKIQTLNFSSHIYMCLINQITFNFWPVKYKWTILEISIFLHLYSYFITTCLFSLEYQSILFSLEYQSLTWDYTASILFFFFFNSNI